MTPDERNELLRDASSLAYTAIRFTGLYKELSSAEWDGLADEIAKEIVNQIERRCDEEFAAREDGRELRELRREMDLHSLGDKPTSISADRLRRLVQLEAAEAQRRTRHHA